MAVTDGFRNTYWRLVCRNEIFIIGATGEEFVEVCWCETFLYISGILRPRVISFFGIQL